MQTSLRIVGLIALAGAVGSSAEHVVFQWPDSSHYCRALVNANQHIEFYIKKHPQWFSQDKLVTDFSIIDVPVGGQEAAAKQYNSLRKLLESRRMYVGTYISGTTALPDAEQNHYPYGAVSIEQMPGTAHYSGSWPGHPTRRTVDISDLETRHALEGQIRRLWETVPAPIRFVDNIPPHPKVLKMQPWEVSCAYMQELRGIGESLGSRVLFNIAMHVGDLSDREAQQLMQAVGQGGIVLEMPWHANVRRDPAATARAQKRYRQLLDSRMAMVMIPVKTPEDVLATWIRTWRKPTDNLYVSTVFTKPPSASVYVAQ
jgi:hypothetical protein